MKAVILLISLGAALPGVRPALAAPDADAPAGSETVLLGRLHLESSRAMETSRLGTDRVFTPGLTYSLNDTLELTGGPTLHSGVRAAVPGAPFLSSEPAAFGSRSARDDWGLSLGYNRTWGRLDWSLASGPASNALPTGGHTPVFIAASLSTAYHLKGKTQLFAELSNNPPLSARLASGLRVPRRKSGPSDSAELGVRYMTRENESISLGLSCSQFNAFWLRAETCLRF